MNHASQGYQLRPMESRASSGADLLSTRVSLCAGVAEVVAENTVRPAINRTGYFYVVAHSPLSLCDMAAIYSAITR